MDFKDPKLLILGGVALVAGFFILKNNQGSSASSPTPVDTSGNATTGSTSETGNTTELGGAYTYLDGSGVQHIIATDPNGNLVSYGADQPAFSSPSSGQLSTYTGYMGNISNGTPWLYGGSPNYSTNAWAQYLAGQGLSSTSSSSQQ